MLKRAKTANSMLVDSHCHLDFPDFDTDRADMMRRAAQAGVGLMVTISTRVRRFDQLRHLTEVHENVFCSIGTHPHNAGEEIDVTAEDLIRLSAYEKCVAIGEAGLDYHYDKAPRAAQAAGFLVHIEAARQTGLPLVIHARNADDDVERILTEEMGKGVFPFVLHCFSSGQRLAEAGIELGGYVSFSGMLTFKNSEDLRSIARSVPHERLLIETDAPYLAPPPHRGHRNEPSYVIETAKCLASMLDLDLDAIAKQTTQNFFRLFEKVPRALMPVFADD
jgi:TatD DNase family protein